MNAATERLGIWVESLSVTGGKVDYVDTTRKPQPLARSLSSVAFSLRDFRATAEGGDFAVSANTSQAERVDWKGRVALVPTVSSQGEFSVVGLRVPELTEVLVDALPFGVTAGLADLVGSYRAALGSGLDLKLQLPKFTLTGLALRRTGCD
jgi:hypothetical protein